MGINSPQSKVGTSGVLVYIPRRIYSRTAGVMTRANGGILKSNQTPTNQTAAFEIKMAWRGPDRMHLKHDSAPVLLPQAPTPHHPQNPRALLTSLPVSIQTSPLTIVPVRSNRGPPLTMSSLSVFRMATRAIRPNGLYRAPQITRSRMQSPVTLSAVRASNFGTTSKLLSGHEDETFEEFSARYEPNRKPLTAQREHNRRT